MGGELEAAPPYELRGEGGRHPLSTFSNFSVFILLYYPPPHLPMHWPPTPTFKFMALALCGTMG